jgi:hypothetical protein
VPQPTTLLKNQIMKEKKIPSNNDRQWKKRWKVAYLENNEHMKVIILPQK